MAPHDRPADVLAHIMRFWHLSGTEVARLSARLGPQFAINPSFIFNLRHSDTIPNLYHLYAISEVLQLRLGSVFSLFGIDLDLFLDLTDQLNGHRTRLIETCPFGSNRMVHVPATLGPGISAKTTAPLWELIPEWRRVPLLAIRDAAWRDHRYRYAQLGTGDTNAAPDIPPGAFIQLRLLEAADIEKLDSSGFYFVQHPRGYTVCRCRYRKGWLELISNDPSFNGLQLMRYGKEALILARVTAFAASLPTMGYRKSIVLPELKRVPRAVAPWNYRSLPELFRGEYLRQQVTSREREIANERFQQELGIGVGPWYIEKLGRTQHAPHTNTALLGTATCGARLSDMCRSCGIPLNNPDKYDLQQILSAKSPAELPVEPVAAPAPRPAELWNNFVEEFHEWSLLISRLSPDPRSTRYEIVRLYQGDHFSGLDPLLRDGAVIAIDGAKTQVPDAARDPRANERDWARTIHVLRLNNHHQSPLLCGYAQATPRGIHLISHPGSRNPSVQVLPRTHVTVMGTLAVVLSPV